MRGIKLVNTTFSNNNFTSEQLKEIKKQIYKTGFVLENKICQLLENNNWNIINNRYYLDDVQDINREIDIIAYKVSTVNDILIYTTFVISCKKSEKNLWAFLTKDIKQGDPNINFYPINNWSNNKILNFMLETINIEERILNKSIDHKSLEFIYGMNKQVFAFQQMNTKSFAPQNDKDIYNSIITTIKSLEYEKNSLGKRIKNKALYNFNLLSIFDGEMIEIHFAEQSEDIKQIDEIKYLNRHIVNKRESFYRVHFMKYEKLNLYIDHLNDLHKFHVEFYPTLIEEFYRDITQFGREGFKLFTEEFEDEVLWMLNHYYDSEEHTLEHIILKYEADEELLYISVEGSEMSYSDEVEALAVLHDDERAISWVKTALKDIFNYEGNFTFDKGFPF